MNPTGPPPSAYAEISQMVIEEDAMSSYPEILTQPDEDALVRELAQ